MQQLFTPRILKGSCSVARYEVGDAVRRPVRDEYVCVRWDEVPLPPDLLAARGVEGPVHEARLLRRAVELQTSDYDGAVGADSGRS